MQFVSAPPLPRLKIGSLLPGYPLSTPLTFQAKIRAVTALLNGVTASYLSCRDYVSDLLIHGVLPAFWVFLSDTRQQLAGYYLRWKQTVEIRKHPMGPVPKWGLYFYWGRGITRVVFNRPLYPAHVDASD